MTRERRRPVAALFVRHDGVYVALPGLDPLLEGVDPWGIERDARKYRGPHPVVAHPPCERWGRLWWSDGSGNPGQDAGCFAAALGAVRDFGGVLEHPAGSLAWAAFGLPKPPRGKWSEPDGHGGRSVHVEQGHFGHRARKATWLYAVSSAPLPALPEEPSDAKAYLMQPGRCSKDKPRPTCPCERCERLYGADWKGAHNKGVERLSPRENETTPIPFRNLLLEIARAS